MNRLLSIMLLAALLLTAAQTAFAETCQYNTKWGVVTIKNVGANVTGSYPYRNGRITGTMNYPDIQGNWYQSDGTGNFHFTLYNGGFTGNWNYTGESRWRGDWNGKLIRCY